MKDISALMRPRSVAIVGDTAGQGRGATIHDHLLTWGFDGPIYSVNPKYDEIRGKKAYTSLKAIGEPIEFVASAIRADLSANLMREAGELGVKGMLFIASGFAESDDEGKRRQAELQRIADEYGMVFCGPNCYGVANLHGGFAAYSGRVGRNTPKGSIALVFQSGALTHGILEPSPDRKIGYSYVITTGNEAGVTLSDYVDYIATDPNTRVIGCFVESFRDLPGFLAASERAVAQGKHMVVLKVGRSERATKAALAHTGALVGDDRLISAALAKVGIIRVSDLDEFLETLVVLDSLPPQLSASDVALASISGGGSGVMSDLSEELGLRLANFSDETTTTLRGILPDFGTVNDPLDITGAVGEQPDLLERAVEAILVDDNVGTLGYALNTPSFARDEQVSQANFRHDRTIGAIAEGMKKSGTDKPVVLFTMTSGAFDTELVDAAAKYEMPLLQGMREGILALSRVQTAARRGLARGAGAASSQPPQLIAAAIAAAAPGALSESESKALLEAAGIRLSRNVLAHSADEASAAANDMGFPVVLKAESRAIPHKTEAGVVLLNLATTDGVAEAYNTIFERAKAHLGGSTDELLGISVQEMAPDGIDFLIGITNDPGVGPAVTLGMGGILTEAIRDVVTYLAPVTPAEVHEMLDELRAARTMLTGTRGRGEADTEALVEAVVSVSNLAVWLEPVLAEADVNPIRVLDKGRGAVALDGLVIFK